MILFVALDTSGLLKRHVPLEDPSQTWPVRVGFEFSTMDGHQKGFLSTQIRSDGRKIQEAATAIHGITTREADRSGMSEVIALGAICAWAKETRYLVGFSVDFYRDVLEGALMRRGRDSSMLIRAGIEVVDLMKPCAQFCKIVTDREDGSYKWPRLSEACEMLLGDAPMVGYRHAWDDCQRAKRLFFELRKRNALEIAA
jgi:DNA polymerase III subunit epsilon